MNATANPLNDGLYVGANITPHKSVEARFVNSVSGQLKEFLQNAFQFRLSTVVETMRQNNGEEFSKLYDLLSSASLELFGATQNSRRYAPTVSTDQMHVALMEKIRHAEMARIVKTSIDRTNTFNHIPIDITTQVLTDIIDNLEGAATSVEKEKARQQTISRIMIGISVSDWMDAIFYYAIRSQRFSASKHLLELEAHLTNGNNDNDDAELFARRRNNGGSTKERQSMYKFAMNVLKRWIQNCREQSRLANGMSSSQEPATSSKRLKSQAESSTASVNFTTILINVFSKPKILRKDLRQAVRETLRAYVDMFVIENPNARLEVAKAEKKWLEKQTERSARVGGHEKLTDDAKQALKIGLSAVSIIVLAQERGYYYGLDTQMSMGRAYEEKRRNDAMCRMFEKFLGYMGAENKNMLAEVGKMIGGGVPGTGNTSVENQLSHLYNQQVQRQQAIAAAAAPPEYPVGPTPPQIVTPPSYIPQAQSTHQQYAGHPQNQYTPAQTPPVQPPVAPNFSQVMPPPDPYSRPNYAQSHAAPTYPAPQPPQVQSQYDQYQHYQQQYQQQQQQQTNQGRQVKFSDQQAAKQYQQPPEQHSPYADQNRQYGNQSQIQTPSASTTRFHSPPPPQQNAASSTSNSGFTSSVSHNKFGASGNPFSSASSSPFTAGKSSQQKSHPMTSNLTKPSTAVYENSSDEESGGLERSWESSGSENEAASSGSDNEGWNSS